MTREELYKKITNIFRSGCLSEDVNKCEFDGVCELHEKVKVLEVVEEYSKQKRAEFVDEIIEKYKTHNCGICKRKDESSCTFGECTIAFLEMLKEQK